MKKKIKNFIKKIASGLSQEIQETRDIPKHIRDKNFKEVFQQIADIVKMAFIAFIWILPAGALISGFLMKLSNKIRPTAFQDKTKKDKDK